PRHGSMQSGIRRTGNRMLVADCLATGWPGYHDGCQQQWRWTCPAACIAAFHAVAGYVQVVSSLLECRVHAYAGRLRQRRGTPPCMPLASHVGTSLGLTQYTDGECRCMDNTVMGQGRTVVRPPCVKRT
ncbi:MAG: hypothetical protein K2G12_04425, partial [Prevotella sp.]|nr:hypothetical protein [Prevotella sp.]